MPTVPTYDNLQVAATALPQARFSTPQVQDFASRQMQETGRAMMGAGSELSKVVLDAQREADEVRINDAMNKAVRLTTDLQVEALGLRGENALKRPDNKSLADEYDERMKQGMDAIANELGNDRQRRAFGRLAAERRAGLYQRLGAHLVGEQKAFKEQTQKAALETAVNQGVLLYGDEAKRRESLGIIANTVADMAKTNGWDKATREAALVEATSPLHAGIVKAMVQGGNASGAQAYYDANSAAMTVQHRAALQGVLKESGENERADIAATTAWDTLGPKGANDAVKLFDMEQAARAELKNDPEAAKKAVAGLRERASAFNAQQGELKAKNIAGVWKLIDGGTPLAQVRRSDAWLALSDTERHDIRKTIEAEAATRANRAANESSRALSEMQRQEKLSLLRNGNEYLTATDPTVLATMSRAQVEAMRGKFGLDATQHLLTKWDTLQKPGKLTEAKMDKQDFDLVADSLGLRPYAKGKSEDAARNLGVLQQRVETLIARAESGGVKLSREDKMDMMRKEMARTVQVERTILSDVTVPVLNLTKAQAERVVVPAADRAKIAEALKAMNKRFPNDPRYFPTGANLRSHYLRSINAPGDLTDDQ